jgi:ABC-type amino acid transport system permease subunit
MNSLFLSFAAFPPFLTPLATVAYLGPDSVLPLVSVLATVIGIVLMFGRYILRAVRGAFQALRHKDSTVDAPTPPDAKS